jgi:hypothetical protein
MKGEKIKVIGKTGEEEDREGKDVTNDPAEITVNLRRGVGKGGEEEVTGIEGSDV